MKNPIVVISGNEIPRVGNIFHKSGEIIFFNDSKIVNHHTLK